MGDPSDQLQSHRVVRITESDIENPAQLERLLQRLYMIGEPVVDLSGFEGPVDGLASKLRHLNQYHTSKGGKRLRIVVDSPSVRRTLTGGTRVFRFYDTVEEALETT